MILYYASIRHLESTQLLLSPSSLSSATVHGERSITNEVEVAITTKMLYSLNTSNANTFFVEKWKCI